MAGRGRGGRERATEGAGTPMPGPASKGATDLPPTPPPTPSLEGTTPRTQFLVPWGLGWRAQATHDRTGFRAPDGRKVAWDPYWLGWEMAGQGEGGGDGGYRGVGGPYLERNGYGVGLRDASTGGNGEGDEAELRWLGGAGSVCGGCGVADEALGGEGAVGGAFGGGADECGGGVLLGVRVPVGGEKGDGWGIGLEMASLGHK